MNKSLIAVGLGVLALIFTIQQRWLLGVILLGVASIVYAADKVRKD